jgi:cellulose synthase/poly-beta-1,6-N-acetylglucosamine synthase-like glycosyltransferase
MSGQPSRGDELATVGFVVIGRNEGARLEQCLRSVHAISHRVVYADSASTDGSPELAAKLGAAIVTVPPDGQLSAARGRNAGYAELKRLFPECDAVQFLDGDCILQDGWIEAALTFLRGHPEVAVVCGRRFEAYPNASVYNALCDQEWNTPVGEATECGGDALIRMEAFDQVGGYRAELRAGEEPEMTARMRAAGWKIWRIDAPMTEHDAKILTLRQWLRRTQRGGYGYAQAWQATKALPTRLYARNLRSAFIWAFTIPLIVVVVALLMKSPLILLAIPVLYGLQFLRIGGKTHSGRLRWTSAGLLLLAKFPEAIGAIRYFVSGGTRSVPEYKVHG